MGETVHGHWMSRFYLREFATRETRDTDNPQVWVLRKDGKKPAFCTSIRNVGSRRHLYSPLRDGKRDDTMEKDLLGGLESDVAPLWRELSRGTPDLSNESFRKMIALYVATTYMRHPSYLVDIGEWHRRFVEHVDQLPKDADGNPLISEVEVRGRVLPFDASDYRRFRAAGPDVPKRAFVDSLHENGIHCAQLLLKKQWSVICAESPVFITVDAPVHLHHPEREVVGLGTAGMRLVVPICPTRLLWMDDRREGDQYLSLGARDPRAFNWTGWYQCEEFMVSPTHPDAVMIELHAVEAEARAETERSR